MIKIDWSKAPEWAVGHGLVAMGSIKEVWIGEKAYMVVGDSRSYVYGGGEGDTRHNHTRGNFEHVTPRPDRWNGEGMPPVGAVCEYTGYEHRLKPGAHVEIIHHFHAGAADVAAFTYSYCGVRRVAQAIADQFRPIRTPEQIAADERLHKIRNALSEINSKVHFPNDLVRGNILAAAVEAMIDAGYCKQVAP